jgi:cystathionine beta-synthase
MPAIGAGESIAAATTALESTPAVIVHLEGKPVGVLTRQDVLTYLMGSHGLN